MRILLLGRYDPEYSRNRILIKGLRQAGAQLVEARTPLAVWRARGKFDAVLAMFPAQRWALAARIVAGRKPLVVDAFTSHYEGYALDRRLVRPDGFMARWYRFQDRLMCRLADAVLTDTAAHAEFFARELRADRSKLRPVFVGADPDLFTPATEPNGPFTVHFYGSYIPLQGVGTIVDAAELLVDQDIRFRLVGSGQTYSEVRRHADTLGLSNLEFMPKVPYARLCELIQDSHICLGIFGITPKTQTVIPNKAFDALAAGRPLITADTPAVRELLDERSAVLVPAGDPRALAAAILLLRRDPEYRHRLGQAGRAALLSRATPAIIGQRVAGIFRDLLT